MKKNVYTLFEKSGDFFSQIEPTDRLDLLSPSMFLLAF